MNKEERGEEGMSACDDDMIQHRARESSEPASFPNIHLTSQQPKAKPI